MKNCIKALCGSILLLLFTSTLCSATDEYYARANLKVLKGSVITWINWQSSPTFIPAGTPLKVIRKGEEATLIDEKKGMEYQLVIGKEGEPYLEKFVTKQPLDLKKYSPEGKKGIINAIAKFDMTKEEVYIAMGPPAKVAAGDTVGMTYEDIMKEDLWIYARRRFGKNIGIGFHPRTGTVNRTEGLW